MNNIKKLCLERDITQKQLAAAIGVSQPTVSDWMNNKKDPSGARLSKLIDYFGVTEEAILGYEKKEQPVRFSSSLMQTKVNLAEGMDGGVKRILRSPKTYVVKGSYGSGKSNLIHGHLHALTRGAYSSEIDATRQILVAKLMGLSDDNLAKLNQYADLLKIQEDMERDAKK